MNLHSMRASASAPLSFRKFLEAAIHALSETSFIAISKTTQRVEKVVVGSVSSSKQDQNTLKSRPKHYKNRGFSL
jgi:hypothetical protein